MMTAPGFSLFERTATAAFAPAPYSWMKLAARMSSMIASPFFGSDSRARLYAARAFLMSPVQSAFRASARYAAVVRPEGGATGGLGGVGWTVGAGTGSGAGGGGAV